MKELSDDLFVNVELDKKRKYGLVPMPDGSLKTSELLPSQVFKILGVSTNLMCNDDAGCLFDLFANAMWMRRKVPSVAVAFHRLRRTVFASVKAGQTGQ